MAILINVHEAKTRFSQLLEQAHSGQEIILAKAGKPYARMVPLAAITGKRQRGRLKIQIDDSFYEALTENEFKAWE